VGATVAFVVGAVVGLVVGAAVALVVGAAVALVVGAVVALVVGAVVGAVVAFVVGAVVGTGAVAEAAVLCVVSAQAVAGTILSSIIIASSKLVIRFFTNMYSFQFLCPTIIADESCYCNLFFAFVTRLLPFLTQKCFLFCIILGICFHIFTFFVNHSGLHNFIVYTFQG
jgi:hypothetical protein